jgi:basic membrane lipoprotein Med (substrate-binding protein (PBP1-ABC) superfamily)
MAAAEDRLRLCRPVTDAGWVRQHEEGRKAVEAALGPKVKTTFVENVPRAPTPSASSATWRSRATS